MRYDKRYYDWIPNVPVVHDKGKVVESMQDYIYKLGHNRRTLKYEYQNRSTQDINNFLNDNFSDFLFAKTDRICDRLFKLYVLCHNKGDMCSYLKNVGLQIDGKTLKLKFKPDDIDGIINSTRCNSQLITSVARFLELCRINPIKIFDEICSDPKTNENPHYTRLIFSAAYAYTDKEYFNLFPTYDDEGKISYDMPQAYFTLGL